MSLNIKNEETHRLAQKVAALTGETLTGAVTEALRERLNQLQGTRNGMAERLLQIGNDCAAHMREPFKSIDHGEILYDHRGLPR